MLLALLVVIQVGFYALGLYYGLLWVFGDTGSESKMAFVGFIGVPFSVGYGYLKSRNSSSDVKSLSARLQSIVRKGGRHRHWAQLELHGYYSQNGMTVKDVVPEYRQIAVQYFNEYKQPILIPAELSFLNVYDFRMGIAELEEHVQSETEYFFIRDDSVTKVFADHLKIGFVQMQVTRASLRAMLPAIETELHKRLAAI